MEMIKIIGPHMIPNGEVTDLELQFYALHYSIAIQAMLNKNDNVWFAVNWMERLL